MAQEVPVPPSYFLDTQHLCSRLPVRLLVLDIMGWDVPSSPGGYVCIALCALLPPFFSPLSIPLYAGAHRPVYFPLVAYRRNRKCACGHLASITGSARAAILVAGVLCISMCVLNSH